MCQLHMLWSQHLTCHVGGGGGSGSGSGGGVSSVSSVLMYVVVATRWSLLYQ